MITEIYISADENSNESTNGINLIINRCNNGKNITVSLVDDGDKLIIPCTFEIEFKELKDAVKKLEYNMEDE